MTLVPLAAALPGSGIPPDATVTSDDLVALGGDLFVYGNAYVRKTGSEAPTHERIPPTETRPA